MKPAGDSGGASVLAEPTRNMQDPQGENRAYSDQEGEAMESPTSQEGEQTVELQVNIGHTATRVAELVLYEEEVMIDDDVSKL